MSKLTQEHEATGIAKDVFGEIKDEFGMVPNFFKSLAAHDPNWLELNWRREKAIMLNESALDRKTKELLAMVVSLVNDCEYCFLAHEAMARMAGATDEEINDAKKVIELFSSFNAIANSLKIPCDIDPDNIQSEQ